MNNFCRSHLFISGRVQGVFFRRWSQINAEKFKVNGFVRNLSDKRVEMVLEGEKERVEKMINCAKRGPIFAKVEKIDINWEEYKGEFKGFEIRY